MQEERRIVMAIPKTGSNDIYPRIGRVSDAGDDAAINFGDTEAKSISSVARGTITAKSLVVIVAGVTYKIPLYAES